MITMITDWMEFGTPARQRGKHLIHLATMLPDCAAQNHAEHHVHSGRVANAQSPRSRGMRAYGIPRRDCRQRVLDPCRPCAVDRALDIRATDGGGFRTGRAMARASTKTTAVSRAYIQRTIDGAGPAWIEDALAAIAAGDSIGTHAATARALRVGHTSGLDMMLGVILGSAVWQHGSEVNQVLSALSCRRSEFHPIRDDNHKRPSSPQLPEPR